MRELTMAGGCVQAGTNLSVWPFVNCVATLCLTDDDCKDFPEAKVVINESTNEISSDTYGEPLVLPLCCNEYKNYVIPYYCSDYKNLDDAINFFETTRECISAEAPACMKLRTGIYAISPQDIAFTVVGILIQFCTANIRKLYRKLFAKPKSDEKWFFLDGGEIWQLFLVVAHSCLSIYKLYPPANANADKCGAADDLPFWTKPQSNAIDWCQFNCNSLTCQKIVTNASCSILQNILDLIDMYGQGVFTQGDNDNSTRWFKVFKTLRGIVDLCYIFYDLSQLAGPPGPGTTALVVISVVLDVVLAGIAILSIWIDGSKSSDNESAKSCLTELGAHCFGDQVSDAVREGLEDVASGRLDEGRGRGTGLKLVAMTHSSHPDHGDVITPPIQYGSA
jgi:hypothetical protein